MQFWRKCTFFHYITLCIGFYGVVYVFHWLTARWTFIQLWWIHFHSSTFSYFKRTIDRANNTSPYLRNPQLLSSAVEEWERYIILSHHRQILWIVHRIVLRIETDHMPKRIVVPRRTYKWVNVLYTRHHYWNWWFFNQQQRRERTIYYCKGITNGRWYYNFMSDYRAWCMRLFEFETLSWREYFIAAYLYINGMFQNWCRWL